MSISPDIQEDMGNAIPIGRGCSLEPRTSGGYTIRFWETKAKKRRKKGIQASTTHKARATAEAYDLWERWQAGSFDPWRDVYKRATAEEAVNHYLSTRGKEISKATRKTNAWAIKAAIREANIKYIADLKPEALRAIVHSRKRNEVTKHTLYGKLNAVLNWMTDQGYFDKNPMTEVRKPKKPQRVPKALTLKDEAKFIAALPLVYDLQKYAKKYRNPYWYVDGLLMALYTGATRDELPGLRWGDVHWPQGGKLGRLIVRRSKNQKDRPVSLVLALPLLERLEQDTRLSDDPNEHILKACDGLSPISGPYLGRKCAAVSELAKLDNVGLHGLRHTFAVNMIRKGVSMRSVQIMLGHDDITTTMIYTTLTSEDVLQDVERAFGK